MRFDRLGGEQLGALLSEDRGLFFLCFGAPWCPACRIMHEVLSELCERFAAGGVRAFFLDVEDRHVLALREKVLWPRGISFSVSAIPVTLAFWQARLVRRYTGATSNARLGADVARELGALGCSGERAQGLTQREKNAIGREAELNRWIAEHTRERGGF